ncbi:MAG: hypothetical protein Q7R30_18645 [Acidobacteriota bacterium]|nr:hypothetical protein [Acidobacteriota bacterium]
MAAEAFCGCANADSAKQAAAHSEYLSGFDGRKFTRRDTATEALTAILAPATLEADQCRLQANARHEEFRKRYINNREASDTFENSVAAHRSTCVDVRRDELAQLQAQVAAKYRAIPDLAADVLTALAGASQGRYRLATDQDRKWDQYSFDNFVKPNRAKVEHYPFIARGDFDGDNLPDLAAEVLSLDDTRTRMALVWGNGTVSFYDGQMCSAIASVPPQEWKSHWESAPLTLTTDAILVACFESSAWLLYWDGQSFRQYRISD